MNEKELSQQVAHNAADVDNLKSCVAEIKTIVKDGIADLRKLVEEKHINQKVLLSATEVKLEGKITENTRDINNLKYWKYGISAGGSVILFLIIYFGNQITGAFAQLLSAIN